MRYRNCGSSCAGNAPSWGAAAVHRCRRSAVPDLRHRHRAGQLAWLEARHRAHARVEDRIGCAKDTGLGRFPSRQVASNAVWLHPALTACDLIA
jgi:hypothetical protein